MRFTKLIAWALLPYCVGCAFDKEPTMAPYTYSVPDSAWSEAFGNHRALIHVDTPCKVSNLRFEWRRPDASVDQKRFLIVNATTGDTVPNIVRNEVSNELCDLSFGPIEVAGDYYFYYLPYQVQPGHGMYYRGYEAVEEAPSEEWLAAVKTGEQKHATVKSVQSRTAFDSFYPMEVCATTTETNAYALKQAKPFYLFPEDRKYPIRMKKQVPYKWIATDEVGMIQGTALQNEYYTFQVGVWSPSDSLEHLAYAVTPLVSGRDTIYPTDITCFNLEGIDPYGVAFEKNIGVPVSGVQPLWFGVDLSETQSSGTYKGVVTITDAKGRSETLPIQLKVKDELIADRGDSEPWRHSRLRWLNSKLGLEPTPTSDYEPMIIMNNKVSCLGRNITVNESTLLPEQINSWSRELLASPVRFIIETDKGVKDLNGAVESQDIQTGRIEGLLVAEDEDLRVEVTGVMEFDGWMNYIYQIVPKRELQLKDVRLELPFKSSESPLFMGMGLPGQATPSSYAGKWDAPEKTAQTYGASLTTSKQQAWLWPFDSFWLGSANAGIHCELRGTSYSGPLLNLYRPAYPTSWYNGGKGGFKLDSRGGVTKAAVYSGARTLLKDSVLSFDFALLVTPVKAVNTESQFRDRYYHNGGKPVPTDEDVKAGVKIINIHHANEYNPYINYPFLTSDKLSRFTEEWHKKDCKVKLYYTVRELTNATPELWALRSLGNEILGDGRGGGFPWCQEHLVTGYTPQWYQHFEHLDELGLTADASILTSTGDSRWYNYYVEGLAWMVKNMDIDGIYLDDVAFDRRILQRMRRAMDGVKPGCIIDLHSNTGFSKGPAMQYAEFFPYVDKLWFGESFVYNKMSPENWLVESSGIPFGLMGDMLHAGGNKWLGMQYGMTVRHPWLTEGVVCDPRLVWKIWDDFDIEHATMIGFWETDCPVKTGDKDVKATVYLHENRMLISVGNYTDTDKSVRLTIAPESKYAAYKNCTLPAIADFQGAKSCKIGDVLSIPAREGLLIYVEP